MNRGWRDVLLSPAFLSIVVSVNWTFAHFGILELIGKVMESDDQSSPIRYVLILTVMDLVVFTLFAFLMRCIPTDDSDPGKKARRRWARWCFLLFGPLLQLVTLAVMIWDWAKVDFHTNFFWLILLLLSAFLHDLGTTLTSHYVTLALKPAKLVGSRRLRDFFGGATLLLGIVTVHVGGMLVHAIFRIFLTIFVAVITLSFECHVVAPSNVTYHHVTAADENQD